MNAFLIKTLARHEKNVAKWGHQDLNTLIIATGEEFGELCKASLGNEGESHDIKKECIDLAALLVEIYEEFGDKAKGGGKATAVVCECWECINYQPFHDLVSSCMIYGWARNPEGCPKFEAKKNDTP